MCVLRLSFATSNSSGGGGTLKLPAEYENDSEASDGDYADSVVRRARAAGVDQVRGSSKKFKQI